MCIFDLLGPAPGICRLYFERRDDHTLHCLQYYHSPGYDGRHRAVAFFVCDADGRPAKDESPIPPRASLIGLPSWIRLPDDSGDDEVVANCMPEDRLPRLVLQGYMAFVIAPLDGAQDPDRTQLEHVVADARHADRWRILGETPEGTLEALHDCPSADEAMRYLKDGLPLERLGFDDFTYLQCDARAFSGDFYTVMTRILSSTQTRLPNAPREP